MNEIQKCMCSVGSFVARKCYLFCFLLGMLLYLLVLLPSYGFVNRYGCFRLSYSQFSPPFLLINFMTCRWISNERNMTGAHNAAGNYYLSGAPIFTSVFFVRYVLLNLYFSVYSYRVLWTIVCLFVFVP